MLGTVPKMRFKTCGDSLVLFVPIQSFIRIGSTTSFIVCDYDQNIGIAALDEQTLTYTEIARNPKPHPPYLHWFRLTMGSNGKLYAQGSSMLSPMLSSQQSGRVSIEYRTLQDNVWTDIALSEESLVKWDTGRYGRGVTRFVNLVGVDAESGLYITLSWSSLTERHFRLVKTNSQGQLIWTLTEQDFNDVQPEIIAIAPNGELWLAEKLSDPDYVYQVRKVRVVPAASSATTTP
jgi:hypothetical protein